MQLFIIQVLKRAHGDRFFLIFLSLPRSHMHFTTLSYSLQQGVTNQIVTLRSNFNVS